MTTLQKVIKYSALALAVLLAVSILGGIFGMIGVFGGIFSVGGGVGEMQTYAISEPVQDLDIDAGAADFYIKKGESFSVESNLKKLKVEVRNGRLSVIDRSSGSIFGSNKSTVGVLTLYIPEGAALDRVKIFTGAGRFTVDALSAAELDFELGAGEVKIGSLVATRSADIEGGAGRITVSGGSLKNLDMDMGVGEVNLTAALRGECSLDMGVGKTNITLLGSKADYALDIDKGIGSITVDGKAATDFGGSGENEIEINGGVGAIEVKFAEAEE